MNFFLEYLSILLEILEQTALYIFVFAVILGFIFFSCVVIVWTLVVIWCISDWLATLTEYTHLRMKKEIIQLRSVEV